MFDRFRPATMISRCFVLAIFVAAACAQDVPTDEAILPITTDGLELAVPSDGFGTIQVSVRVNTVDIRFNFTGLADGVDEFGEYSVEEGHLYRGTDDDDVGEFIRTLFDETRLSPDSVSFQLNGQELIDGEVVAQIDELIAGAYYVNFTTVSNPAGELRGQIVAGEIDVDVRPEDVEDDDSSSSSLLPSLALFVTFAGAAVLNLV